MDNEIQGSRGAVEPKNGDNNAANHKGLLNNFKMPRNKDKDDGDERLDTIGGDDDYDGKFFENDNEENNDEDKELENNEKQEEYLIEVDLEKIRDDEELDIEKRFTVTKNLKPNTKNNYKNLLFSNSPKKKTEGLLIWRLVQNATCLICLTLNSMMARNAMKLPNKT